MRLIQRPRPQPFVPPSKQPAVQDKGVNSIVHGDCEQVLKQFPDGHFDSVVTDPPYGLSKEPNITEVLTKWLSGAPYDHKHGGFMGKAWDSFVPHPNLWKEVYRTLKPGGYALVFAGTRTQDLMTVSLRLAGFEVRDVIEWLYFTGFPKSMDVGKAFDKRDGAEREVVGVVKRTASAGKGKTVHQEGGNKSGVCDITAPATDIAKQWDGWGTALKPAHEPIIVVRKPLSGTVADNVERFGTGAINIDGCRIAGEVKERVGFKEKKRGYVGIKSAEMIPENPPNDAGRFPANIVTVEEDGFWSAYCNVTPQELCKKASSKDRNSDWQGNEIKLDEKTAATHNHVGRDMTNPKNAMGEGERKRIERGEPAQLPQRNNHPTVKPTPLMAWLLKLVTPPGGRTLDPFAGSGSTPVAARQEGFDYVGIEQSEEYIEIARARAGL